MNRIDHLIIKKYPGQLIEVWGIIEVMKLDYDTDQFLEEDILENILMELDII